MVGTYARLKVRVRATTQRHCCIVSIMSPAHSVKFWGPEAGAYYCGNNAGAVHGLSGMPSTNVNSVSLW